MLAGRPLTAGGYQDTVGDVGGEDGPNDTTPISIPPSTMAAVSPEPNATLTNGEFGEMCVVHF